MGGRANRADEVCQKHRGREKVAAVSGIRAGPLATVFAVLRRVTMVISREETKDAVALTQLTANCPVVYITGLAGHGRVRAMLVKTNAAVFSSVSLTAITISGPDLGGALIAVSVGGLTGCL